MHLQPPFPPPPLNEGTIAVGFVGSKSQLVNPSETTRLTATLDKLNYYLSSWLRFSKPFEGKKV